MSVGLINDHLHLILLGTNPPIETLRSIIIFLFRLTKILTI